MTIKRRTKIDILLLAIVVAIGLIAVPRAQAIGDWWHFANYSPPPDVRALAEDSGMNEQGRRLFYRFSPQTADDETLLKQCGSHGHGCIIGRSIYISNKDIEHQYNQAIVTAAHEMLHVVYERLENEEKDNLREAINEQLQRPGSERIKTKLKSYEPIEFYNEAHSFIGSETDRLTPELEEHFSQFFSNREKPVKANRQKPARQ